MTRPGERRERPWTAQEIARMRELCATLPTSEVARQLDRTPDAVRQRAWLHKIRLSRTGPTHGRIATYNKGCRCPDCRRVAADRRAFYRARTPR